MAGQIHTRTRNLKKQVEKLTIEIDEIKRQQQVSEIVETDYFQDLQSKARQMRRRDRRGQGNTSAPDEAPA
jgi:hypothetical protein